MHNPQKTLAPTWVIAALNRRLAWIVSRSEIRRDRTSAEADRDGQEAKALRIAIAILDSPLGETQTLAFTKQQLNTLRQKVASQAKEINRLLGRTLEP
ncbi:MAG: hypothetical protein WAM85_21865 [Terracidiphilus sp.]